MSSSEVEEKRMTGEQHEADNGRLYPEMNGDDMLSLADKLYWAVLGLDVSDLPDRDPAHEPHQLDENDDQHAIKPDDGKRDDDDNGNTEEKGEVEETQDSENSGDTAADSSTSTSPSLTSIADQCGRPESLVGMTLATTFGLVPCKTEPATRPSLRSETAYPFRIFSNEFLEVRHSTLDGLGVFATRDIPPRTQVLVERAVCHAHDHNLMAYFNAMSKRDQELVLDLHGHKPFDDSIRAQVRSRFHTNNFLCDGNADGAGLYLVGSRFNHTCVPFCNISYCYDYKLHVMTWSTNRDIRQGQELTITYGKGPGDLKAKYGFTCKCGCWQTMRKQW